MSSERALPDRPAAAAACHDEHHCITCSDEGVPMRVLEPERDGLALCADRDGASRPVETSLVGAVAPGDTVLVHAGVALTRLRDVEIP